MTAPPGIAPAISSTGRPPQRVSRDLRRRLAAAVASAAGVSFAEARAVVAQAARRAGGDMDEVDAYLRSTYRLDPTGVTAVRNVMAGRS